MGLDACVYCDCYEKGKVRTPPQPELVYVDECGQVSLRWDVPGANVKAFDAWVTTACEHDYSTHLIHHRLGNIALVGFLRLEMSRTPDEFPILLSKVVYNGTHGGDHLDLSTVELLQSEMEALKSLHCDDPEKERYLRTFEHQMTELIQTSLTVRKPVAF